MEGSEYFSIPIHKFDCPNSYNFRENLLNNINSVINSDSGVSISNYGGYHSNYIDASTLGKEFCDFLDDALKYINDTLKTKYHTSYEMWINVNKKGDFNIRHIHPYSVLSAVFYVKLPKGDNGNILFEDPIRDRLMQPYDDSSKEIEIKPEEGQLIFFPSFLTHRVLPNFTDEDRISIALNFRTKQFVS